MERKQVFDKIALVYDEIRPSYPQQLIDHVIRKSKITLSSSLLDIGAGTGKATIQFARKGFPVHCIELGENLACLLRDKCKNYNQVTVEVNSFEDWQPKANEKYHLIYSAQAFHWINPEIKYKKCYNLLHHDGYLALFWYQPDYVDSPVRKDINKYINEKAQSLAQDEVNQSFYKDTMDLRKAEILDSGYFTDLVVCEYPWYNQLSAEEYVKSLQSWSKFACLDDKSKDLIGKDLIRIITKHGGFVPSKLIFSSFIAKTI